METVIGLDDFPTLRVQINQIQATWDMGSMGVYSKWFQPKKLLDDLYIYIYLFNYIILYLSIYLSIYIYTYMKNVLLKLGIRACVCVCVRVLVGWLMVFMSQLFGPHDCRCPHGVLAVSSCRKVFFVGLTDESKMFANWLLLPSKGCVNGAVRGTFNFTDNKPRLIATGS